MPNPAKSIRSAFLGKGLRGEILRWAFFFLLGTVINALLIEPSLEPTAARMVGRWHGSNSNLGRFPWAVIDITAVKNWFPVSSPDGSFDSGKLKVFLDAVEALKPPVRPKVIGFDIAAIQRDDSFSGVDAKDGDYYFVPPQHRPFLAALEEFETKQSRKSADDRILVRIGSENLNRPDPEKIDLRDYPHLSDSWATVRSFREADRAPLRMTTPGALENLGVAVLNDYRIATQSGVDFQQIKEVPAPLPSDWPAKAGKPDCIYVNFQALRRRKDFTFQVPSSTVNSQNWTEAKMFDDSFVARLADIGYPQMWFVGMAADPGNEDLIALDESSYAAEDSLFIHGVYQHVAIVYSLMFAPVRVFSFRASMIFDFIFSLIVFAFLASAKKEFSKPPSGDSVKAKLELFIFYLGSWVASPLRLLFHVSDRRGKPLVAGHQKRVKLLKSFGSAVIFLFPFVVCWVLALWGWYWYGFLSVLIYMLVEHYFHGEEKGVEPEAAKPQIQRQ